MNEIQNNLGELEKRIQNLITSHQQLRAENDTLKAENLELISKVDEEKVRAKRIEEGYMELRKVENEKTGENINRLQQKINDIISEIDKTVSLTESN